MIDPRIQTQREKATASESATARNLSQCVDAAKWAESFMAIDREYGIHVDEGTMLGWFANAIMAGYDHAKRVVATVEAVTREWQPIGTHPKDSRWLLGWEYDQGCFVFRDGPGLLTGEDPMPTHWMPLPAPPVEGTSQTENSTLERPQCPQCKKSTTVSQLLQYGACCDCSEDAPYDEVEGTSAQDDQGADHGRTPSR